jgi:arylsulfatase A-like enzyme
MLSVDCLRADMPWNGYERPIAPNLTRLAEESTVYTNAYSASSYTAQSVAAILSGRLASTLYRSGVFFTSYPKANLFFPEVLAEKGIRSMGWFSHLYFGRGKGIDQGFDVWELVPGITFNPQTDEHVTSDKMLELGLKILKDPENTKGPFFAWAHFGDPHDQYIKHKEAPDFGNKTRDKYDSEVWYTDYHIGKLLDWARQQSFWERTAVIITGDHGEAFGEHGQYRHAFEIWENLVRVPLVVHLPGAKPQRISERRSHLDLAPTIVELLGLPPLEQFMGKSLVKEIAGTESPKNREPILVELTEDSNNPQRRAIISGDYKLTVRGRGAAYFLYNLAKDPGETENRAASEPEKLAEMKALYEKTFGAVPSIDPYGGNKLESGRLANGPMGPAKSK